MARQDEMVVDESADGAAPVRWSQVNEATDRLLPRPPPVRRRRLPEELGVIVALGLLIGLIGAIKPAFVDPDTLLNLTASNAFIGILALGMVFRGHPRHRPVGRLDVQLLRGHRGQGDGPASIPGSPPASASPSAPCSG